jgi:hypothetical protein
MHTWFIPDSMHKSHLDFDLDLRRGFLPNTRTSAVANDSHVYYLGFLCNDARGFGHVLGRPEWDVSADTEPEWELERVGA